MNIAILGFGTVGQGIYHILDQRRSVLEEQCGQEITVKKILVRDTKKRRGDFAVERLPLTDSFSDILTDGSIDIVFEVMSDGPKGVEYAGQLLANNKHVISANKAAIASAFFKLQDIAREAGVHFRFEAAVAGGIPLIDPLSKIRHLNSITGIGGIINGSTNYILSELSSGRPHGEVMAEAKTLGVLEEDPTDDVEGYDARRKIAILAAIVLSQEIEEENIPTIGITKLSEKDFLWAKSENRTLKLVASLTRDNASYQLSVLPTALTDGNSLTRVGGVKNQVQLTGDTIDSLAFYGSGGGMYPTAHALWADFFDVINSKPTYYDRGKRQSDDLSLSREAEFYLREPEEGLAAVNKISVKDALAYQNQGFVVIEKEQSFAASALR